MDINKVKKFDKAVLNSARDEIVEERADKQKEEAKGVLREIFERKDKAEEIQEDAEKELKEVGVDLKVFNKK